MTDDNVIEQNTGNVSFCGFVAFIRRKFMSELHINIPNCVHSYTAIALFLYDSWNVRNITHIFRVHIF